MKKQNQKCYPLVYYPISFLKNKIYLFIYWLHWVFDAANRLSLVAESGSYSPGVVHRLLTAVASLVAEHRLEHARA